MTITKNVIADLWPLYADGSASGDTRQLVEEYLREHPEWAAKLQAGARAGSWPSAPCIGPDQEVRMLNRIKKRVQMVRILLLLAIMFTAQAFGRIVADTTWTRSPRVFIVMSLIAGACWIWWAVASWRLRRLGP